MKIESVTNFYICSPVVNPAAIVKRRIFRVANVHLIQRQHAEWEHHKGRFPKNRDAAEKPDQPPGKVITTVCWYS